MNKFQEPSVPNVMMSSMASTRAKQPHWKLLQTSEEREASLLKAEAKRQRKASWKQASLPYVNPNQGK